jgi:DNA repair protein RecN (Recombination protein N)
MLVNLAIRDVVLIDRLDLSFDRGLCVLTGETGAGKSILLDALGLALGNRADARLLRPGAKQAVVSAAFDLPEDHGARALMSEQGIAADGDSLVLRRVLGSDNRSRGFVNDQPVSIGLLRALGDVLIEVQGQLTVAVLTSFKMSSLVNELIMASSKDHSSSRLLDQHSPAILLKGNYLLWYMYNE